MTHTRLSLSQVSVLSDAWGLSNRKTKPNLVREIATDYDPRAVGVLVGMRRKKDGKIFLIDGHHRMEGIALYCALNNLDPQKTPVQMDLYEESDVKTGSVAEFIDDLRQKLHSRAPESAANEVQRHWSKSPWKPAFEAHSLEPKFQGPMSLNSVVAARLIADQIQDRLKGGVSPSLILEEYPRTPSQASVLQAQKSYPNAAKARSAVDAAVLWEQAVSGKVNRRKFHSTTCLVFAILVYEDPANTAKGAELFSALGEYLDVAPDVGNKLTAFVALQNACNYKKPKGSRHRVHLLGRPKFGV